MEKVKVGKFVLTTFLYILCMTDVGVYMGIYYSSDSCILSSFLSIVARPDIVVLCVRFYGTPGIPVYFGWYSTK